MFQSVKGMPDLLPEETTRWRWMENRLRHILGFFGYEEIRTPLLEPTELFARSMGASSDIVEKEMFSFEDKGGTLLALRPEATASVLRAYLEHHLEHGNPLLRLYYMGPMFRHEKPQKGRYRQFSQVGIEILGSESPFTDVEVIAILHEMGRIFGCKDQRLELNSVGDEHCRPAYRAHLLTFLQDHSSNLCETCLRRMQTNPMRVFDCKGQRCQQTLVAAPMIVDHLCSSCLTHFDLVKQGLQAAKIPFVINPRVVRGLDYYTKTAFEMTALGLGAQNAVGAGGRYDGLAEVLGGAHTPAVGFAVGMERLLQSCHVTFSSEPKRVVIVPLGQRAQEMALALQVTLHQTFCSDSTLNVSMAVFYSATSLKSALRQADKNQAFMALLIGDKEVDQNTVLIKNLTQHSQKEVPLADVPCALREELRDKPL